MWLAKKGGKGVHPWPMNIDRAAVVLAAGEGKRMQSHLPKVMHLCAGIPLVSHVVKAALESGCTRIVLVVSPFSEQAVRAETTARFPGVDTVFAVQPVARGTGDAVRVGVDALPSDFKGDVCVLCGDVPLLRGHTLKTLFAAKHAAQMAFMSAHMAQPFGYGRVVRNAKGGVLGVVEQRDATLEQQQITEINAGVYCVDAAAVRACLKNLTCDNAQKEYYFTDVIGMLAQQGGAVACPVEDVSEVMGVNTPVELAQVSSLMRKRVVEKHLASGVVFTDPSAVWIDAEVCLEAQVQVGVGVQLYGATHVMKGAVLEGPLYVKDSVLGPGVHVRAFSHLEQVRVQADAQVGPYARLRPGTVLEEKTRVGNFVELKNTHLGVGSKVNHLSYVGDAEVHADVNVGAGTITCNYDGVSKHRTVLEQGVFVGSHTTLVAPVCVKEHAYVAAGSVITKEVPAQALAFGRAKQVNREGYAQVLRARQKQSTTKK